MVKPDFEARALNTAERLIQQLSAQKRSLVLAESCTAGLAADFLARVPGASRVFWGSFVCYTADAKVSMLGLDRKRLEQYRLVSKETARDMALGALAQSDAYMAGAVTGLAGPDGDGSAVPVGTVFIACAVNTGHAQLLAADSAESLAVREYHFQGSRNEVRLQAAAALLEILFDKIMRPLDK
ncbi:MAG: CinA family protein [Treponema sp.]|jgi:PncC family amidohydrolase|nr:CinA family protein [Treponema sp.]